MPPSVPSLRTLAVVVLAALAAAACAGDGNDLAVDSPTTTEPAPTTTTTAAPATTTTSEAEGPEVAPLTGLPVDDAAVLDRPALFLKIDNHPDALPQQGLDQADLVIEMLAEFQLSRFAAVFHSSSPEHVGPVRSSRTSDFDLLRAFDHPLYGSSGGNDNVLAGMRSLPVHDVTAYTRTEYYRDSSRRAPHNLYVDTEDLFALAPDDARPPTPWFTYRDEGDALPASARPAEGPVTVRWAFPVTFEWDDERQGWTRSQDGDVHELAGGAVVAPANVVILTAEYGTSSADRNSPDLQSVGEGEALILTAGHLVPGRWIRSSPEDPPALFAQDGGEVHLTPGQTWVVWPREGRVTY